MHLWITADKIWTAEVVDYNDEETNCQTIFSRARTIILLFRSAGMENTTDFEDLPLLVWLNIWQQIKWLGADKQYQLIVEIGYLGAKRLIEIVPELMDNSAIQWEINAYEYDKKSSILKK